MFDHLSQNWRNSHLMAYRLKLICCNRQVFLVRNRLEKNKFVTFLTMSQTGWKRKLKHQCFRYVKQDSNEIFLFEVIVKSLRIWMSYVILNTVTSHYNSSFHISSSGFWVAWMFDEMGLDIQNVESCQIKKLILVYHKNGLSWSNAYLIVKEFGIPLYSTASFRVSYALQNPISLLTSTFCLLSTGW